MNLIRTSPLLIAIGMLAGCATRAPQPSPDPAAQAVDDIISKYAASATTSLRNLSEIEGTSKITVPPPAPAPAPVAAAPFIAHAAAPVTREGAPQPQVWVVPQYIPYPTAAAPAAAPAPVASPAPVAQQSAAQPASSSVRVASGEAAGRYVPSVRPAERITFGFGGMTGPSDFFSSLPPGLSTRITLMGITDDVEGLLDRIARQINWTRAPSTGIKVSPQPLTIEAVDKPAIEVIRDLGGATGRNAEIVVMPGLRTLTVNYPVH